MSRNTFTEGKLKSFERMMQSVSCFTKDYEPPKLQPKGEGQNETKNINKATSRSQKKGIKI